ncbi:unnamed protein product, partial [Meganyctiphanes norvegica]
AGLPWLGGRGTGTEVLMLSGATIPIEQWNYHQPEHSSPDYCLKLSTCSMSPYAVQNCALSKPFVCGCDITSNHPFPILIDEPVVIHQTHSRGTRELHNYTRTLETDITRSKEEPVASHQTISRGKRELQVRSIHSCSSEQYQCPKG